MRAKKKAAARLSVGSGPTTREPGKRLGLRRRSRPRLTRPESFFWFAIGAIIGTELIGGIAVVVLALLLSPEHWMSLRLLTLVTIVSGLAGGYFGITVLPGLLKIRRRYVDWRIDVEQVHAFTRGNDPWIPAWNHCHDRLSN